MPLPAWAKPIQNNAPPSWAQPIQAQEEIQPEIVAQERTEPGFMSRVGSDIAQRASNVGQMIGRNTQGGFLEGVQNIPQMGALAAGQVAGAAGDIIGEGIKSGYETIVPGGAQEAIKGGIASLLNTTVGKMGVRAMKAGGEVYTRFKEMYPDAAMALEGGANIVGLSTGGKKAGEALGGIIKEPTEEAAKAYLAKKYSQTVTKGINKSIRPGVEGKRTFGQAQQYYNKAEDAISTIIDNKNALQLTNEFGDITPGKLPENLTQFSQAISQTKNNLYNKYNALAESAGQKGATVELKPIAKELSKITDNPALIDNAPGVVDYANQRIETYLTRGAYTAKEAQDALTYLNNSLETFYKNPSFDSASKAYVDSIVANNIRKSLDSAIEGTSGAGYQGLKNQYGSLKAIERDVNRRAIVDARKSGKGLIDFSDVLSGERAAAGILSMNPAIVGEAAAMKTIAEMIKKINDPNRIVKSMFSKAEQLKNKLADTSTSAVNTLAQ